VLRASVLVLLALASGGEPERLRAGQRRDRDRFRDHLQIGVQPEACLNRASAGPSL